MDPGWLVWPLAAGAGYLALLPGAAEEDRLAWCLDRLLGLDADALVLVSLAALSLHALALFAAFLGPPRRTRRHGARLLALVVTQEAVRRLLPLGAPRGHWRLAPALLIPGTPSAVASLVPVLWRRQPSLAVAYALSAALFCRAHAGAGTWDAVFGGLALAAVFALLPAAAEEGARFPPGADADEWEQLERDGAAPPGVYAPDRVPSREPGEVAASYLRDVYREPDPAETEFETERF